MKGVIVILILLLTTDAFSRGRRRSFSFKRSRKSRSFFGSSKKKSRSLFKRKKTVAPAKKKKKKKIAPKVIHKTTVINRNHYNDSSRSGGLLDMYINYKIMEMVFNPKSGQMECPPGSLLNTQTNQCVSGQQIAPAQQPVQQVQPIKIEQKSGYSDSDTI